MGITWWRLRITESSSPLCRSARGRPSTLLCHLNCLGDSFAQRPMRSRIRKSLLLEQPNDLFRPASPKQNNVLRNIDHLKQGREIKILVCAAGNENDRLRDTLQSLYRRMSFKPANRIRMFGLRRSWAVDSINIVSLHGKRRPKWCSVCLSS